MGSIGLARLLRATEFATFCCVLLLASCARSVDALGVVVRVDAEPALRADIASMVTRIYGSDGRSVSGGDVVSVERTVALGGRFTLPYTIGIGPRDHDASRIYRLEIDALDASGAVIAQAKVISGYRPGAVLTVTLILEDACRGVVCSAVTETCRAARCVDAHVDPTTLPAYGGDAGDLTDASIATDASELPDTNVTDANVSDAGEADAGITDAGPMCGAGSVEDASGCTDIDECLMNNGNCDTNATCTNTPGSWGCTCNAGYAGDGFSCADVNECLAGNGGCHVLTTCTNTLGGRTCGSCPAGYTGDGETGCVDVNECMVNNGGCHANGVCTNTPGSRTCACAGGYSGDGFTCADVNECLMNNGGCVTFPSVTCTNTQGNRTCGACPGGYVGDGTYCTPTTYSSIALGANHSCALRSDNTLWCWGNNTQAQIGDGTTTNRNRPTYVMSNVRQVAAGQGFTCAILMDSTLYCWGLNSSGQLGDGSQTDRTTPTLVSGGIVNWSQVSAGAGFACAYRANGSIRCWGDNGTGQFGNGTMTSSLTPVQSLGTTLWGAVAAGTTHACGARPDGHIWCWGQGSTGVIGNGSTAQTSTPMMATGSSYAEVSTGASHTCARTSAGQIYCWGYNNVGQNGYGNMTFSSTPAIVTGTQNYATLAQASGSNHVCGRKTNGTLWCWGAGASGQLGTNTTNASSPRQVASTTWTSVATGGDHTCALRSDNTLWCWGYGALGQLGYGGTSSAQITPIQVGAM